MARLTDKNYLQHVAHMLVRNPDMEPFDALREVKGRLADAYFAKMMTAPGGAVQPHKRVRA